MIGAAMVLAAVLAAGTPVDLMVLNEVTTKTAKAGDRFAVVVIAPVSADGTVVVPINTRGWGEVIDAHESGIVGQSGKLKARLLWLDVGGSHLPLLGEFAPAGQGAGIQTALFTLAISPLGLLTRGNNAKLKAGERITGVLTQAWPPVPTAAPDTQPASTPEVVAPVPPPR